MFRTLVIVIAGGCVFASGYFLGKTRPAISSVTSKTEFTERTDRSKNETAKKLMHDESESTAQTVLQLEEELPSLLSKTPSSMSYADLDQQAQALLELAVSNPQLALQIALREGMHTADETIAKLLKVWANVSPELAWNWILENEYETPALILEEIAKADPLLAESLVNDLVGKSPSEQLEIKSSVVRGFVYTGDYQGAFDFIVGLQESNLDGSTSDHFALLNNLTQSWVRFSPVEGLSWIDSLPDDQNSLKEKLKPALLEEWSISNPVDALEYAMTLPSGTEKQNMLNLSLVEWAQTDIEATSVWLNEFGQSEEFDYAVLDIAVSTEINRETVDDALGWAESIHDSALREEGMTQILSSWLIRDRPAAIVYLEENNQYLPEKVTTTAIKHADFNALEEGQVELSD